MAPDQIWPIGLAMPLPAMSGAEPWTGSNIDGNFRSGLMFADGAIPIVPVTAGPRSERMSPKRLRADDDVEPVGVRTKCARQDVDVVLVDADVRIAGAHRFDALVPERHGVDDAVGLGGGGQVLAAAVLRQLEGVAQDPVDAAPGEDVLLDRHLVRRCPR